MSVRIKGRGGITVVDVSDNQGEWGDVVGYVARHISKAQGFFRDERLALAIGDRKIDADDLQAIHEVLKGQNISVVALHTSNPASYLIARQLGLETVWEGASPPPVRNETGRGAENASASFPFFSSQLGRRGSANSDGGRAMETPSIADRRPQTSKGEQPLATGHWSRAAAISPESSASEREARDSESQWTSIFTPETNQGDNDLPLPEAAPREDDSAAVTPWGDASAEESESPPYVYRGTLRSGQSCRHAGTIVILGDVNPGAQVIGGGDVLVWGRLRGFVQAGAMGDAGAIVAALDFEPVQLRIAAYIAMTPKGASNNPGYWFWKRDSSGRPEVARVINEQIYVDPWDASGSG